MPSQYGYYLPLSDATFESVRYLNIEPKSEGLGDNAVQKTDKDGQPVWTVTCLVRVSGGVSAETESFTLPASRKLAEEISKVPELTPIALLGLRGGKWSRQGTDRTEWSFQISGLRVL